MKIIIVSILILILFAFCNDNITEPNNVVFIKVNPSDDLIPSKLGNYWIYVDTLIDGNSWKYGKYNTTISSQEIIEGKTFFTVDNLDIGNMSFSKYTIDDKKIYSQFPTWVPNQYAIKLKLIPATLEGTMFETAIASDTGGDIVFAKHYQSEYKAGNYIFSEYFEYKSERPGSKYQVIIIPGIGVVDYYLEFVGVPRRTNVFKYHSSLISYKLN